MNKEPICVVVMGKGEEEQPTFYFNDIPTYEQVRDAYYERNDGGYLRDLFDSKDKVPTGRSRDRHISLNVYFVDLYILKPMWVDQVPKEEKTPKVTEAVINAERAEKKRILNKYTLKDTIVRVMAVSDDVMTLPQIAAAVVKFGYKTEAIRFSNTLRVQLYRLTDNDLFVVHNDDDTFSLTEKGWDYWTSILAKEFSSKISKQWLEAFAVTPGKSIAKAYEENKEEDRLLVLADVLEEHGAGKEILAWVRHAYYGPVFACWLANQ